MKFPKAIKVRGKTLATIYGRTGAYGSYRVAWAVHGKRQMKAFRAYGGKDGALAFAEDLARGMAKGSQAAALSPPQATDALAALERLEAFRQSTGKRFSLLAAVSEFAESAAKLNGRTLGEAVEGYLSNVASVNRKDLKEAVEEFLAAQAPLARSNNGDRSQISGKYHYNREIQLRRFAETFPNHSVCDLGKEHVNSFVASLGEFSAKSRNHYRTSIRQFLDWTARQDYLARAHRLFEADGMRPEHANTAEIKFYTPQEFRCLLEAAEGPMQAILALGGLAGLRTAELLRLDWSDIWRVPGHIEITAGKAKTRQRRLVETCSALAAWLEPFRSVTAGKVWADTESVFQKSFLELSAQAKVARKDNGLRHGFCTYSYVLHGENATAQQAGHAPALLHANYRGLATKAEAEKWFAVAPAKASNVIPMAAQAAQP